MWIPQVGYGLLQQYALISPFLISIISNIDLSIGFKARKILNLENNSLSEFYGSCSPMKFSIFFPRLTGVKTKEKKRKLVLFIPAETHEG